MGREVDGGLFAGQRPYSLRVKRHHHADFALGLAAVTSVVCIGVFSWWYRFGGDISPAPLAADETPVAAAPHVAPAASGIRFPIGPAPASAAAVPELNQSDAVLLGALTRLLGRQSVQSQLQADGFVRRFVATIDNLGRARATSRLWPVKPAAQRFVVEDQAGDAVVSPDNDLRYTAFVVMLERIDAEAAVSVYAGLYPLFQQAYADLGHPRQYFNDRLVDVIDHLLAAPEPSAPLHVRRLQAGGATEAGRPVVYEFADPELEALSAGQKLMVRMGGVNERRVKARLSALRTAIVARGAAK